MPRNENQQLLNLARTIQQLRGWFPFLFSVSSFRFQFPFHFHFLLFHMPGGDMEKQEMEMKRKLEMEIGNGNGNKKHTNHWCLHSVLSYYSCILLSNGYRTGFMSHVLCL